MNAQDFIDNARRSSEVMYRDGVAEDRLAFRVGMLEGYVRQLCNIINDCDTELKSIMESMDKTNA